MFGFGAFDSNPENANNFNDEVAVVGLTNQTIIGNKTKPSRSKMTKLKNLQVGLSIHQQMGSLFHRYFWLRKRRAETMQKLDTYIDEHGGTPKAPEQTTGKTRDGGGVTTGMSHKATASPKKLIPQAIQVCLILGDNVPGLSITEEKRSVLASRVYGKWWPMDECLWLPNNSYPYRTLRTIF